MLVVFTLSFGSIYSSNNVEHIQKKILKLNDVDEKKATTVAKYIDMYSKKFKLDARHVVAIGSLESNYVNMVGDSGNSIGIFQIQLRTTQHMYDVYKNKYDFLKKVDTNKQLKDSLELQTMYACLYLKFLKDRLPDHKGMFLAYNAGLHGYNTGKYNSSYYNQIRKRLDKI